MTDAISDITIVGGGDSGLLTGLAIQKLNPEIDISIVDDFRQDVPQVGKSTYWKIQGILYDDLEIDPERFVTEVKPVWKCTVFFRDWCGYPSFHFPFDISEKFPSGDTPRAVEYHYNYYENLYDSPDHRTRNEEIVAQGTSPWYFDPATFNYEKYQPIAYHLNTKRFNEFLRDVCRERGISLINDEITGVDTDGDRITRIRSEDRNYVSDLYIDASGFARVLMENVESEFTEFPFPLDSAFNTRVERPLSEVVSATVVESGEYGWFWQIDTFDNRDMGYVFASDFVSEEEARAEFIEYCEEEFLEYWEGSIPAEDVTKYEFTSGYYDPAWKENCLAIGNAGGFVEPLQSTGLTTNALAAVNLSKLLSNQGRINASGVRDYYNSWVRRAWESIGDFIAVHYAYSDGENAFWQSMQSIELSPRVEHIIRDFDRTGFDTSVTLPTQTRDEIDDLTIFAPESFYVLMRDMGATSEFYETNEFEVSDEVEREQEEYYRKITEEVADHLTTRELYMDNFDDIDPLPES